MHGTLDTEVSKECPVLRKQAKRGIKSRDADVYGCMKDMKKMC